MKNMKKSKFISLLLTVVFVLTTASNALANDYNSWDKRKAEIEAAMIEAYSNGDVEDVNKKLDELGLELLGSYTEIEPISNSVNGNIEPLSYGSDVTVTSSYYRDRFTGRYLVKGFWSWNATMYYDPASSPYDAFGLWLSKVSDGTPATGQVFESQGCAVYNTYGNYINGNMWYSDFDVQNAGVAWTVADLYNSSNDYIGDKGQGWIWMTSPPSQPVYLRAKLLHTFSGGTISGISIGTGGLNYTLSPEVQSWAALNPITTIYSWPSN